MFLIVSSVTKRIISEYSLFVVLLLCPDDKTEGSIILINAPLVNIAGPPISPLPPEISKMPILFF